jgi:hypothetical protein
MLAGMVEFVSCAISRRRSSRCSPLYATEDQTAILEIVYRTRHADEVDHHTIVRLAALDRDLVRAECMDYDPLGPAFGFLTRETEPATRYSLRARLQRIYKARVSALLALAFGEID